MIDFLLRPVRRPFCNLPRERVLFEREKALARRDGFPVSPGQTLSFFGLIVAAGF